MSVWWGRNGDGGETSSLIRLWLIIHLVFCLLWVVVVQPGDWMTLEWEYLGSKSSKIYLSWFNLPKAGEIKILHLEIRCLNSFLNHHQPSSETRANLIECHWRLKILNFFSYHYWEPVCNYTGSAEESQVCVGHAFSPLFSSNNYLLCSDHKSSQTLLIHLAGPSAYYREVALIKPNGIECGSPRPLEAGVTGELVGSLGRVHHPLTSLPPVLPAQGCGRACGSQATAPRGDVTGHLIPLPCFSLTCALNRRH